MRSFCPTRYITIYAVIWWQGGRMDDTGHQHEALVFSKSIQTVFRSNIKYCSDIFLWCYSTWSWALNWTQKQRLRMRGAIPPFPSIFSHIFCLIKHKDNFSKFKPAWKYTDLVHFCWCLVAHDEFVFSHREFVVVTSMIAVGQLSHDICQMPHMGLSHFSDSVIIKRNPIWRELEIFQWLQISMSKHNSFRCFTYRRRR